MKQHDGGFVNVNDYCRKKTATRYKMYGRSIGTIALPALFLLLTSISVGLTYPVYATGGSNETAATQAPSGASIGPADNGANVTTTSDMQSACLPQNATTATVSPPVNGSGGANATTTSNTTTTTFAPGGASIGGNDTGTLNATTGNTAGNTSTTFAPSGASIC
jgi:hypothetical protein